MEENENAAALFAQLPGARRGRGGLRSLQPVGGGSRSRTSLRPPPRGRRRRRRRRSGCRRYLICSSGQGLLVSSPPRPQGRLRGHKPAGEVSSAAIVRS